MSKKNIDNNRRVNCEIFYYLHLIQSYLQWPKSVIWYRYQLSGNSWSRNNIMINLLSDLINTFNNDRINLAGLYDVQNLNIHIYSKARNSKYISCNNEMLYSLGLNKTTNIIGQTDFDFPWSDEAPLFIENDAQIISQDKPMLFLEPGTKFDGNYHIKVNYLSYKRPLRIRSKKIIGITGLSFILNGSELPFNNTIKLQSPENLEAHEKLTFYSTLESRYPLSKREKECLYYLTKGMALKQIARVLNLSPRTIEHHVESVKLKLGCFSRAHLVEKILVEVCGTKFSEI